MIDKIRNEEQYNQVLASIEVYIKKATEGGGFHSLSKTEENELGHISVLAEQYEDKLLTIMPLCYH